MSANAEIIAELRRVLNERDEARAQRTRMAEQIETLDRNAETFLQDAGRMRRERDEARADAERYLADLRRCAAAPYEHAKERAEAFRRGAEAMREACQQWCRAWENNGDAIADALADLRVEDKP